jgi:hypothetical protein
LLYKRRSTLTKGLPSLQIATTTIKTETTTKITKTITETTKTTKTLVAIKHTDNLIATVDLRDVATSAKKRIAGYGNIQIRNRQERKRLIKASLITAQMDTSTIALRNSLSSILLSAKKEVTKI